MHLNNLSNNRLQYYFQSSPLWRTVFIWTPDFPGPDAYSLARREKYKELQFSLNTDFSTKQKNKFLKGDYTATVVQNKILLTDKYGNQFLEDTFILSSADSGSFFELKDVIIGVDFHWEQKEKIYLEKHIYGKCSIKFNNISEAEKKQVVSV